MNRQILKKSLFDIELKDLDEPKGIVAFYFASWNNVDLHRDIFTKNAYNKTFSLNKKNIYHNRDHITPVGTPISFGTDENGAYAVSQLAIKTVAGNDTFEQYKAGLIKGHSQEVEPLIHSFDPVSKVRTIKEARLWGITSVTRIPANLETPTIAFKSLDDYYDLQENITKLDELIHKGNISDELGQQLTEQLNILLKSLNKNETINKKKEYVINYDYIIKNIGK